MVMQKEQIASFWSEVKVKEERLAQITEQVRQYRFCSVQQLSQHTGASPATIRRDLQDLSQNNQIRLTRGGAMDIRWGATQEPTYDIKKKRNLEEKARIGRSACTYINPGDTVIMDTGTTLLQMAMTLSSSDTRNVTVATNDISCAMELAKNQLISLHMLGGLIREGYYTALGCWTQYALEGLHVDKLFLSCDAIGLVSGCTITNVEEIAIKQAMIKASQERTLLCDHTKFMVTAFMRLCDIGMIHRIITGKEIDPQIVSGFTDAGVEMVLV